MTKPYSLTGRSRLPVIASLPPERENPAAHRLRRLRRRAFGVRASMRPRNAYAHAPRRLEHMGGREKQTAAGLPAPEPGPGGSAPAPQSRAGRCLADWDHDSTGAVSGVGQDLQVEALGPLVLPEGHFGIR